MTEPPRRDWLAKTLAGTLLGLSLSLALGGLVMRVPGSTPMLKAQLAMWLVAPLWMGVLSLCFLFRSGVRAWVVLALANLGAYGLLLAGRPLPILFGAG